MKVEQILLYDNGTNDKMEFMDLITFKEEVDLEKVKNVIKLTQEVVEDYSNEDIYEALKHYFGEYKLVWLGQLPEVAY